MGAAPSSPSAPGANRSLGWLRLKHLPSRPEPQDASLHRALAAVDLRSSSFGRLSGRIPWMLVGMRAGVPPSLPLVEVRGR